MIMLDVRTGRSRCGGQCRSPRAADNGPDGAYSNYLALTALGGGADVQHACRSGEIVVLAMSPRHDGRKERSCWPTAGVGEPISSATLHVMRRTEVHDDNPRIRQLLLQGFGQAQAVLVLQAHSEKDHLYLYSSPAGISGVTESAHRIRRVGRLLDAGLLHSVSRYGARWTYNLYSLAAFPPKIADLSLFEMSRLDSAFFIAGMLPIACG